LGFNFKVVYREPVTGPQSPGIVHRKSNINNKLASKPAPKPAPEPTPKLTPNPTLTLPLYPYHTLTPNPIPTLTQKRKTGRQITNRLNADAILICFDAY